MATLDQKVDSETSSTITSDQSAVFKSKVSDWLEINALQAEMRTWVTDGSRIRARIRTYRDYEVIVDLDNINKQAHFNDVE